MSFHTIIYYKIFNKSVYETKLQPIFLMGKMFNKNISKQKLFFRQIALNQFIIHASKDLIITLLFI